MTKITIPTDAKRVLLVANNGICSLFVDGNRVRMFQLDHGDDNFISIGLTVKKLADLARVVLIQNVDSRALLRDPDNLRKPRWYETLAEAAARHAELVEAAALKDKAAADLKRAEQLEATR